MADTPVTAVRLTEDKTGRTCQTREAHKLLGDDGVAATNTGTGSWVRAELMEDVTFFLYPESASTDGTPLGASCRVVIEAAMELNEVDPVGKTPVAVLATLSVASPTHRETGRWMFVRARVSVAADAAIQVVGNGFTI